MKSLLALDDKSWDRWLFFVTLMSCFACLLAVALVHIWAHEPLNAWDLLISPIVFVMRDLVSYKWGTSAGSKDKDETIKNILQKNNITDGGGKEQ